MATSGPDGGRPRGPFPRSQNGRRNQSHRGRGGIRNGIPDEPAGIASASWDRAEAPNVDINNQGEPNLQQKSRRGRGFHHTRAANQRARPSGNHLADDAGNIQPFGGAGYPTRGGMNQYSRNESSQSFTQSAQYQQTEPVLQQQQRGRRGSQNQHPRSLEPNYSHHPEFENRGRSNEYSPVPIHEGQVFYHTSQMPMGGPSNSADYYQPAPATGPPNSKQSRGQNTTDYRRGNFSSHNGNESHAVGSSSTLEHQPFENIGREYYNNSRPKAAPPHVNQQQYSSGGPQDARYRRDTKVTSSNGSYVSQDVRYRRDDSNNGASGYGPSSRQREDNIPMQSKPGASKFGGGNKAAKVDSQNWRSEGYKKGMVDAQRSKVMADTATQRERLTTQLTNGTYECMVCCESVKPVQPTWNCSQCFHVFHLGCVKRWSRTSQDESGQWRCPGCQSTNSSLPNAYLCFCSKQKDPDWNRREIPHSCGEVCGKALDESGVTGCTHTCTLLCHPGPCPTCSAQTQRKCPCGKKSQLVKCGSSDALLCGEQCGKMLSCGLHPCLDLCHIGPCQSCPIVVEQKCFCNQSTQQVPCSVDHPKEEKFECDRICDKLLNCGHHRCEKGCHEGDCESCQLQVAVVKNCPCGKRSLEQLYRTKSIPERKSCADPVPVCGLKCGRILSCGPAENPHSCSSSCHSGPCPTCPLSTLLRCRCNKNEKNIECKMLSTVGEVLCERRCNKKRQCGRHKCIQVCCIDPEHICPLVCQRPLSCGKHRCEALCHAGNCNRCYNVSFDELRCQCGTQVIYPPVPCGARPPDCTKPCTRMRTCGHPQLHNCHPDATPCPPCVALCEKFCYGKHELRKNVPCHLTEVSCGKPCGKPLKCGRHTCLTTCHTGPCPTVCSQPCPVPRPECGHPCALACHKGACPVTTCKEKVKVQCQCGQRHATVSCEENEMSYKKMATGLLASKMAQLQSGETVVDLKDLLGASSAAKTKSLDCNDECAVVERNRRLALALQIKNPNPKPGAPVYPELLKNWAKKDARFAQMVHDRLTELVQLAKQSVGKMKSRSHSFDSMNRDKRQFIHEYCVFFGCESISYDEEPKRNVVATAYGDLSFLPAVGITEVVRRELGQPSKMPKPPRTAGGLTVLTSGAQQQQSQIQSQPPPPQSKPANAWGAKSGATAFRTLSEVVKSTPVPSAPASSAPSTPAKTSEPSKPAVVDYFDFTS